MKTISVEIANDINPLTVITAIERLVRSTGLDYACGQGGDLTGWKDKDLHITDKDYVFVLRLRKND
jgi:hypothetical protein